MFTKHCRRLDRWTKCLLLRMLKGIATRNYEACAEAVPEAFGLSSSSVSRRYVKGTARKLAEFQERSLEGYDLVALFLDGKSFADEEIIIAPGRHPRRTEDSSWLRAGGHGKRARLPSLPVRIWSNAVCSTKPGLLVVIDGAKGLYKAVMSVLKGHACVQRCQYHKRQNVVSYLSKSEQSRYGSQDGGGLRQTEIRGGQGGTGRAQTGLEVDESVRPTQPRGRHGRDPHTPSVGTDADAQGFLPHHQLHRERQQSPGAAHTTNVRRWTNSSQRHRWVATALLDIEPTSAQGQGLSPSADAPASHTSRTRHQTARDDGPTHSPEPVICFNWKLGLDHSNWALDHSNCLKGNHPLRR